MPQEDHPVELDGVDDWINAIPMTDPWCCYGNMDPINIPHFC